ncbi:MAG: molybdenum cofactor guanylyltransferase [Gammaproteobacteria bacterium]|nr:molybdenum cofactor guanylyltransferase [Gammaproteobacteria bacterium]
MQDIDITAVVLAGGRGQRMGMRNKGLLPLAKQPLIAHVIARLTGQLSRIVISANDDLDAYRGFGLPVIADEIPGYPGPLGGMYSALHAVHSEWLITAPCDTPYLPLDYVERMCAAINDHRAYVARDDQRLQTGFCLLHRSILPQLAASLATGQFAVYRFLSALPAQQVQFADKANAFTNINTPDALAALASR